MKKTLLITSMALGFATINAQDYEFWGLTQQSGDNNKGTIYKTDSIGENHEVIYSFSDGDKPTGSLLLATNGKLYGSTSYGGASDMGIMFSIDPSTEVFTKIADFNGTIGGRSRGSFMQHSDGMLYHTSFEGGAHSKGTIIQLNPNTNAIAVMHDFGANSTDPSKPLAGELLEVSNGKLYGVTRFGGQYGDGTIFEYDPNAGTVTKLFDFSSASNGGEPFNSLMQASNGLLYGTTYSGGPTNNGAIFAYDIAMDTFAAQEYLSNAGTIGTRPQGALIEGSDGLFYGMTSTSGTLFAFDPLTTDVASVASISDGRGTMMEASNGKLYGVRYNGGIIEYDINTTTLSNQDNVGNYGLYGHLIEVEKSLPSGLNSLLNERQIDLYPNPTNGVFIIDLGDHKSEVEYQVITMDGKTVMQDQLSTQGKVEIDLTNEHDGVYLIVLKQDSFMSTMRLVKF